MSRAEAVVVKLVGSGRVVRRGLAAAAVLACAGGVQAVPGTVFNWNGNVDDTWSTANNWTSNATAPDVNNPSNTGNNQTAINFKTLTGAAANRDTLLDLAGAAIAGGGATKLLQNAGISRLFSSNFISLNAGADGDYSIRPFNANLALRMVQAPAGGLAIIENQSNKSLTFNIPVAWSGELNINGGGAAAGDIVFQQQLSDASVANAGGVQVGAAQKGRLVIAYNRPGKVSLEKDNTFSDGIDWRGGTLAFSTDKALGTGKLAINGGVARPMLLRAEGGNTRTIKNLVEVNADFGVDNSQNIRVQGEMAVKGAREIKIFGGTTLAIARGGGKLTGNTNPQLTITGDTEPTFAKGKVTANGSTFEIEGKAGAGAANAAADATGWGGPITVIKGTMVVNAPFGGAGATATSITVGDGTNAALLKGGKGRATALPAKAEVSVNMLGGVAPGKVTIKKAAAYVPGNSPGVMGFEGGNLELEGGSRYGVAIDGTAPGEGPGFHSQTTITGGSVVLLSDPLTGQHPILEPFVDGTNFLSTYVLGNPFDPLLGLGSAVGIIDQLDSQPSLLSLAQIFESYNGAFLSQGSTFTAEDGFSWQISYTANLDSNGVLLSPSDFFGSGNDVAIRLVGVPTPSAAVVLGLAGLVAGRRRRSV